MILSFRKLYVIVISNAVKVLQFCKCWNTLNGATLKVSIARIKLLTIVVSQRNSPFQLKLIYISTTEHIILSHIWCWKRTNIWDFFFKIRFILESDLLICTNCSNCTIFARKYSSQTEKWVCVRETKR